MTFLGGHVISISATQDVWKPIKTGIGGIAVDLASAPIAPGSYTLDITTGLGGVELFVPRNVRVLVDRDALVGGNDDVPASWEKLLKTFRGVADLPATEPAHLLAPDPGVVVHVSVTTGIGGLSILRV